jgi:hypothetical protein
LTKLLCCSCCILNVNNRLIRLPGCRGRLIRS